MTKKEQLNIHNEFLIKLHTASWTGNKNEFTKLMTKLAAYSYARTNSNEWETNKEEKRKYERTLKGLSE